MGMYIHKTVIINNQVHYVSAVNYTKIPVVEMLLLGFCAKLSPRALKYVKSLRSRLGNVWPVQLMDTFVHRL